MKIEILYAPQFGSFEPAQALVEEALYDAAVIADVDVVAVKSEAEARNLEFIGSPTIRVDGLDVEPLTSFRERDYGIRSRHYSEDGVTADLPSYRMVRDSIEIGYLAALDQLGRCC